MKSIAITKPLKVSAAALRKNLRPKIGGRYDIASVLSFPKMLYFAPESESGELRTKVPSFNVAIRKSETFLRLAAYFRDLNSYNENRSVQKLGNLTESLFKSYAGLNQLTQALWNIYKSNNLQLSHSLLALIRTINQKNGIELDSYFESLPKLIQIQNKTISVLKKVDRNLLGKMFSIHGNSPILNIGKREIHRYANTIERTRRIAANNISRFTENFLSMTPLLLQIYEGIETGVYLYSADTYRNAKTLQRLTNSLWKIYLGQNMELSRSFSRLITRINQENKSFEMRNAENNVFSDNRSLKNLVNALRRAFSGSNLELRNSMINLFGDIHNAGKRRNLAVNKHYDLRSVYGVILIHKEIVPENVHMRLDHKKTAQLDRPEQSDAFSRFEREIKTRLDKLETVLPSAPRANNTEDIVKSVLEQVNKKQQLDWKLEKLQRGIF